MYIYIYICILLLYIYHKPYLSELQTQSANYGVPLCIRGGSPWRIRLASRKSAPQEQARGWTKGLPQFRCSSYKLLSVAAHKHTRPTSSIVQLQDAGSIHLLWMDRYGFLQCWLPLSMAHQNNLRPTSSFKSKVIRQTHVANLSSKARFKKP